MSRPSDDMNVDTFRGGVDNALSASTSRRGLSIEQQASMSLCPGAGLAVLGMALERVLRRAWSHRSALLTERRRWDEIDQLHEIWELS